MLKPKSIPPDDEDRLCNRLLKRSIDMEAEIKPTDGGSQAGKPLLPKGMLLKLKLRALLDSGYGNSLAGGKNIPTFVPEHESHTKTDGPKMIGSGRFRTAFPCMTTPLAGCLGKDGFSFSFHRSIGQSQRAKGAAEVRTIAH